MKMNVAIYNHYKPPMASVSTLCYTLVVIYAAVLIKSHKVYLPSCRYYPNNATGTKFKNRNPPYGEVSYVLLTHTQTHTQRTHTLTSNTFITSINRASIYQH
jgi:hypothetical protein